ncbi:MAG: Gfo/Idh/MocA family oxidoreductase [Clostridia bacterium]|nr:Gfo/Idh/MocA family oxidoreductase [Clostridia bacterium]
MRYALIGCGRVSGSHIKAAIKNNLEIAALCDIVPEKAQLLKEKYNLEAEIFSDYKEMLRKISPELVAIATVSGTHGEIATYCAENGFNFMVEKPMAMSIAEADRVIAAAEKSGVTAGVCHQNRFNIAVQELRRAIDDNRFGKLSHGSVHIRWCRDEDYYSQDDWRGKWASDGGALMNQCIHGIDLLRWMMGDEIESVYGSVRNVMHPYIEAEDIGVAVINFKNGAVATVEGTVNTVDNLEETLCVFGEKGMVLLGGMNASAVDVWKFKDEYSDDESKRDIAEKASNVIYGNGHQSLYYNVIEAVENKIQPYVDLYAGKRALEVVLAIYKSTLTGEKVNLPLEDFGSVEMTDIFIEK